MRSKWYSKHGVVSKIQIEDEIKESDMSDHRPVWVELKYKTKETEESDSENEGEETGSVDEGEETESEQKTTVKPKKKERTKLFFKLH